MKRVVIAALVLAAASGPVPLVAQNSVYGVLGVGFPGRLVGVRARALGSGIAAFDPESAVNPAAAAAFGPLTVVATSLTSLRSYEAGGTSVDGLRETQFPFVVLGTRLSGTPFSVAASATTYADRTFDLTTSDTVVIRGVPLAVADRLTSRGAIADVRGAVGWAVGPQVHIGIAGHLMSGSALETVSRAFADTSYLPLAEQDQVTFSGLGISGGIRLAPVPWLHLAGAGRTDTRLRRTRGDITVSEVDLPTTVTGGLQGGVRGRLLLSVTASWRSWSTADDDLAPVGNNAFDTWELGVGLELGVLAVPIRLGARYAQLPFSPTADRPREIDLAFGTGIRFANNRATFQLAVERAFRDGGGASERAWQFAFGLLVRP